MTLDALDRIAAVGQTARLSTRCSDGRPRGCSVRAIASEIQDAATRISGLVMAIKGFTHMDQATVAGPVDLAAEPGQHRSPCSGRRHGRSRRKWSCSVEPALPRVRGFAGELSQIWANLIDNALDAVPDGGRVEVTAVRERQRVTVRVVDNGAGIPDRGPRASVRARSSRPSPSGRAPGLASTSSGAWSATTTATSTSTRGPVERSSASPCRSRRSSGRKDGHEQARAARRR